MIADNTILRLLLAGFVSLVLWLLWQSIESVLTSRDVEHSVRSHARYARLVQFLTECLEYDEGSPNELRELYEALDLQPTEGQARDAAVQVVKLFIIRDAKVFGWGSYDRHKD